MSVLLCSWSVSLSLRDVTAFSNELSLAACPKHLDDAIIVVVAPAIVTQLLPDQESSTLSSQAFLHLGGAWHSQVLLFDCARLSEASPSSNRRIYNGMSFFGFDASLPRGRSHNATAPGFGAAPDPFAGLSSRAQAFDDGGYFSS